MKRGSCTRKVKRTQSQTRWTNLKEPYRLHCWRNCCAMKQFQRSLAARFWTSRRRFAHKTRKQIGSASPRCWEQLLTLQILGQSSRTPKQPKSGSLRPSARASCRQKHERTIGASRAGHYFVSRNTVTTSDGLKAIWIPTPHHLAQQWHTRLSLVRPRETPPPTLQHAARPIARPASDAPLLARIVGRVDGNLAEPLIGVRLRIIRNRVGVPQIFANVFEGFHLLLPGLGEIGFAAGPLRAAFENVARDRVLVHFGGGDHVERNALVLGHGANVVRRHHAGVVGTVGEDDDHLAAGDLGGIAQRKQERVIERGIVARDALHRPGGS